MVLEKDGSGDWRSGLPPVEPGLIRIDVGSIVMDVAPDPTGRAKYAVVREFRQNQFGSVGDPPADNGPQVIIFGKPEVKFNDTQRTAIAQLVVRLAGIEPPAHKIWTAVITSGRGGRLVPATSERQQRGQTGPANIAKAEVALTDRHLQALAGPIEKVLEDDPALSSKVRQFLADMAMQSASLDEQAVSSGGSAPGQEA